MDEAVKTYHSACLTAVRAAAPACQAAAAAMRRCEQLYRRLDAELAEACAEYKSAVTAEMSRMDSMGHPDTMKSLQLHLAAAVFKAEREARAACLSSMSTHERRLETFIEQLMPMYTSIVNEEKL